MTNVLRKNLFNKPSYFIATGCGCGLAPKGPGTVGTLWAWAFYLFVNQYVDKYFWVGLIVAMFLIGVYVSNVVEKETGKKDLSAIVIDEIVAFWIILVMLPHSDDFSHNFLTVFFSDAVIQIMAFFFFRFFDILKPWPVSIAENQFNGGVAVMLDDLVAAFLTLIILSLISKVVYFSL